MEYSARELKQSIKPDPITVDGLWGNSEKDKAARVLEDVALAIERGVIVLSEPYQKRMPEYCERYKCLTPQVMRQAISTLKYPDEAIRAIDSQIDENYLEASALLRRISLEERRGKSMTKKEVRETLEKQLQLLSERSQEALPHDLIGLTQVMSTLGFQLEEDLKSVNQ